MTILAIGERLHDPGLDPARVARWELAWRRDRVGAILTGPAMPRGSATRTRLTSLLGLPDDDLHPANLLPPSAVRGEWDREAARRSGDWLRLWIAAHDVHDGVVLLGRRVARALDLPGDAEWGSAWTALDVGWVAVDLGPFLVLPHPSGTSRLLNDPARRRRLRARVREWAEERRERCLAE